MSNYTLFALVMGPMLAVCCIIAACRVSYNRGCSHGFSTGWECGARSARRRRQEHWDIEPQ